MAFQVDSKIEIKAAFPAFGTHDYHNKKTKVTEVRSAHRPKPKRYDDGNIAQRVSNQYANIVVFRIFNTLIRKNTAKFFDNPAVALDDFDKGYAEVSFAVTAAGAFYNYHNVFTGPPDNFDDGDVPEKAKYPINSFVIDGENFGRKKLSDVREVKDKTYSVNINVGDYIVISCLNKARVGMCKQLTLLYRVEDFGVIAYDWTFQGDEQKTTLEYSVANCKLAYVIATDAKAEEARVGDPNLISKENIKKFRGEIMDWVKKCFDGMGTYSTEGLNFREIGKNMFVHPYTIRSLPDDWTKDAIGAINLLELEGGDGGNCFDEDRNYNIDDVDYERELEWHSINISSSLQNEFAHRPITCFVKDYIGMEVGTLRNSASDDDYRQDKARLVNRNFVYNHKVTIQVDARWIEDDKIEVTFAYPSVASLEIGAYTFIFEPDIHMKDQLSHVFFKDIAQNVRHKDGSLTHEVILDRGMTGDICHTKYITTLTDHYNPQDFREHTGLNVLPTSDDDKEEKATGTAAKKGATAKKGTAAKKADAAAK